MRGKQLRGLSQRGYWRRRAKEDGVYREELRVYDQLQRQLRLTKHPLVVLFVWFFFKALASFGDGHHRSFRPKVSRAVHHLPGQPGQTTTLDG